MIIKCPKCDTKFKFDESRLSGGPVKVKCKNCEGVFAVKPKAPAAETARGAVDGAPVPAPKPIVTPTQGATRPTSAVPEIAIAKPATPQHVESAPGNFEMNFEEAVNLATDGLLDAPFESEFSLHKKRESGSFRPDSTSQNFNDSGLKPRRESTFKFGSSKVVDAIEDSSGTMALAAEAAITAPRPEEGKQTAINEELYLDDVKKTHELPPQLYKLREVDFEEGNAETEIELSSDSGRSTNRHASVADDESDKKSSQLQIRELKGIRQENAPKIVSYSRVFTRSVKGAVIFLALLTMLLTALVALEGDQFNIVKSLSFWNNY